MKIKTTLIGLLTIVGMHARGQNEIEPLKIGEKIPDLLLRNVRNYIGQEVKLSDFKGKLLILDFWNRGCKSCIAAFPKMEKLQQKYHDNLQILLVTNNSDFELKELFQRSAIIKSTRLPFVIGNVELYKLFPHAWEPFHVWIDTNLVVRSITSGENANEENLEKYFRGIDLKLNVRVDQQLNEIKANRGILAQEGCGRLLKYLNYSSSIFGRIIGYEGAGMEQVLDSVSKKQIGVRFINMPKMLLYQYAYNFPFDATRIILEVSNPGDYFPPKDESRLDEWKSKNWVSYELIFHNSSPEALMNVMRQDLERFFRVKAEKQVRVTKCFALVWLNNDDKDKYLKAQTSAESVSEQTLMEVVVENMAVSTFSGLLRNNMHLKLPLLNETRYSGDKRVNIRIPNDSFGSLLKIRKELNKIGLDLVEVEREIEILLLKEITN